MHTGLLASFHISLTLISLFFVALPLGTTHAATASAPKAAVKPAKDDDDQEEGGETPDGEDRAPAGTGHGKGKGTGEEGILGDVAGVRPFFERYGVTFDASETSEVLGNLTGGRRQGAIYEGLFSFALGVDLEKLAGLKGTTVNVSVFVSAQPGTGL